MKSFSHYGYAYVTTDYERRMALYTALQQGLMWVSSAYVNGQTRMRFGKYVEARKPKIPYQGIER